MQRVIIFSHSSSGVPAIMMRAARAAIAARNDFELAALCLSPSPSVASFRHQLLHRLRVTFDPLQRRRPTPPEINARSWCHRHGIQLLSPPNDNINDPAFIAGLQQFQPAVALSFYCLQRFHANLLMQFSHAANYHNGTLPAYRGLRTTSWSIYNAEAESGFTFHRMTEAIDEGRILIADTVRIAPDAGRSEVEFAKAAKAATRVPELLQMLADNAPGKTQIGKAHSYSEKEATAITRIEEPSKLSSDELLKRLRAFDCLELRIGGNWYSVTALLPTTKPEPWAFATADGRHLRIARIDGLPPLLHRLRQRLRN